ASSSRRLGYATDDVGSGGRRVEGICTPRLKKNDGAARTVTTGAVAESETRVIFF
ncbi:hypothetical protein CSUI_006682, partial [Cystoisospora suis]